MKKINFIRLSISIFLCLLININIFGQSNPETPETEPKESTEPAQAEPQDTFDERAYQEEKEEYDEDTEININLGYREYRNGNIIRVGMVDFGLSTYLDENNSLDLSNDIDYMDQRLARSYNIGIHLINVKLGFGKKDKPQRLGFSTGIKWNMSHYSFEKDYKATRNVTPFQDGIDYDVPELKHNRLKANHLQVPFLLEFNSNPERPSKSFNLAIGVVYQFLLNSNYKYKTQTGEKTKIKGDFNLARLVPLAEVRLGYGPLNFYVQYGNRLFQKGDGPLLKPLNIGVNIIPR